MTVGSIRDRTNDQKFLRLFNLREVSRRGIVILQMLGDGLIMIMSSYLSFKFVTHLHSDIGSPQPFPYVISTIGTTTILIGICACSGVYDVFDEFSRFEVLKSTIKCATVTMLIFTATLFIFKVSSNLSRLWLATWSSTSPIALCGFRLLAESAAQSLRQTGQLRKNVAIVGASEVGQLLGAKFIHER